MARTQKNKATALHLGLLKARLAKLRRELITPKGGGGATGEGKLIKVCLPIPEEVEYNNYKAVHSGRIFMKK